MLRYLDVFESHRKSIRSQNVTSANIFVVEMCGYERPCDGVLAYIGKWVTRLMHEGIYGDSERDGLLFDLGKLLRCPDQGTSTWDLELYQCEDQTCRRCGVGSTIESAISAVIKASDKSQSKNRVCYDCFIRDVSCMEGSCPGHD